MNRIGRPPAPNPKVHVVGVRLSEKELTLLDGRRGATPRAAYLRSLLHAHVERRTR